MGRPRTSSRATQVEWVRFPPSPLTRSEVHMNAKPLTREQLDAYRAAMRAGSEYPAWRLFATNYAAHEDEARALDVSRDLFAALEALRDSGLDSDEAKAKARAAIHKARGVL